MTVSVAVEGLRSLDGAMTVMTRAFDPRYGEAWTAAQCNGVLTMPGADLLIARDPSGAPIGFALLRTVLSETELMLIAVAPESRGRGVARALLGESVRRATHLGARRFLLEVRADNDALSLYRHVGFVAIGRRRDYYRGIGGELRDAITLAREI